MSGCFFFETRCRESVFHTTTKVITVTQLKQPMSTFSDY